MYAIMQYNAAGCR